jgi:hypothetical protein
MVTTGMTDAQVLGHYRHRDRNPYMNLRTAQALYGLDLKHGHQVRTST